jgi:hypothetical protein
MTKRPKVTNLIPLVDEEEYMKNLVELLPEDEADRVDVELLPVNDPELGLCGELEGVRDTQMVMLLLLIRGLNVPDTSDVELPTLDDFEFAMGSWRPQLWESSRKKDDVVEVI